jgi:hypothetical protein
MTQLNTPGQTLIPDGVHGYTHRRTGRCKRTTMVPDMLTGLRLLTLGFFLTTTRDDEE